MYIVFVVSGTVIITTVEGIVIIATIMTDLTGMTELREDGTIIILRPMEGAGIGKGSMNV